MKQELETAIASAVHELYGTEVSIELTRPEEKFGDYSTNVALQIAKNLQKSPRDIAEELGTKLKDSLRNRVSDISIAGPGFINLKLNAQTLIGSMNVKPAQSLVGKTVVAEYSDPNPFKPLHAGHLYTTLVGDSISRLLEIAGGKVIRINYGGDVGLHVARAMWGIISFLGGENSKKLENINPAERADWMGARYVEGNTAYSEDEQAKQEITKINSRVYRVHEDNDQSSEFARIYWTCRQWSYDYFPTLYEQLGVIGFDRVIPESEVTKLGTDTVLQELERGVYERSEGAVIFNGEKFGLHTRVFINSDGLPTYEAKDVGLLLTKWKDYHFDQSIVITANEQAQYMEVMLKSVEQFEPEPAEKTTHLTHGMVKLPGNIKMSSREGNTLGAEDILTHTKLAISNSFKEVDTNSRENTMLASVKYAFLKNRLGGDIIYDPKESVSIEGNSGPYLQYAHARARSILNKIDAAANSQQLSANSLTVGERSLVRKISEYPEVVDRAVADLMPHHIANYLYELAQIFNRFYEHNRVIGDERQSQRLALVERYADTLKTGLNILGISAPDKM